MKMKPIVVLLALGWAFSFTPLASAASDGGDWVTVDTVLVNRLGGVNVAGSVSCAGTYQLLMDGQLTFQDENGEQQTIPAPSPGDKVNLAANNDNYTVSQPVGRKSMIQVTHGSSRMNPCFVQEYASPDGSPMSGVSCDSSGSPCRWETDAYGYDHEALGPLFDYSPNGKFKAGNLSVTEQSIGLLVMVHHLSGSWDTWYIQEGSYSMTSRTVRAASYR
jgi:hypothetical protein